MVTNANKRGLGKGLGALLSSEEKIENIGIVSRENNNSKSESYIKELDINLIEPNKNQPRKNFNQNSLEELAKSIEEFGVIQPIIVNKEKDFYKIIAGERRWRASKIVGLKTVPAIIRTYDEMQILQIALIENIQRENLNPIEEALCYQKLVEYFFFTKEDIANKVGKSRNTIGSMISLLNLDVRVQNFIAENKLMLGQAKKLLVIEDNNIQFELANKIIDNCLSLKQAEELIQNTLEYKQDNKNNLKNVENQYKNIEENLINILGTNVSIKNGKKKGKIEIEYYSEQDLDRIICMFNRLH